MLYHCCNVLYTVSGVELGGTDEAVYDDSDQSDVDSFPEMTDDVDNSPVDFTVFQIPNPAAENQKPEIAAPENKTNQENDKIPTATKFVLGIEHEDDNTNTHVNVNTKTDESAKEVDRVKSNGALIDNLAIRRVPGSLGFGIWTKVKIDAGQTVGHYTEDGPKNGIVSSFLFYFLKAVEIKCPAEVHTT